MLEKLDMRYESKSTFRKISIRVELVFVRYWSVCEYMSQYVDRLSGLVKKFQSISDPLHDTLEIGMLVAAIDVDQLMPVIASIKTLPESSVTWEHVASRGVEETNVLRTGNVPHDRESTAQYVCPLCQPGRNTLNRCFHNPLNPNNRLNLKSPLIWSPLV